jgi:uncharacterized protein YegL
LALELVEQGKRDLKASGISYTRPWLMVISDGEPTDDKSLWADAARACKAAEASKKVVVFAIGVEGANFRAWANLAPSPPSCLMGSSLENSLYG